MSLVQNTQKLIEHGQSDRLLAIPTGLPKYDTFVYGTRQGCYYLYGAESGVGKTTFVREKHMHVPYELCKAINDPEKLDVLFIDISLEISAEINLGAAISRKIFMDYQKVVPVEKMFGWNKKEHGKLTEEETALINSYDSYFEEFTKKLFVVDEDVTPTKYHDLLFTVAKQHGSFSKEGRWISECGVYTPKNPNLYIIVLVDTINLSEIEPTHDTIKSSIDRISRISVWFRNKCNMTPIIIQQFNADISATDRKRYGVVTPLLRDFEDSKRTTKDANIVCGLYDPQRHIVQEEGKEKVFKGYDIEQLGSWFRSLHLLKNRNGRTNKFIPLKFDGAVGVFEQLPDAIDMDETAYRLATRHN